MKRVFQTKRQQILGLDTHIKRIIRETSYRREYWEGYYGGMDVEKIVDMLIKKLHKLEETDAT